MYIYIYIYISYLKKALESTEKDISFTFEKLANTSNGGGHCKTRTTSFPHFKLKTIRNY